MRTFSSYLLSLSLLVVFATTAAMAQNPPATDPFGAPAADPFAPAPLETNDIFKPVPDPYKFTYNDPFANAPEPFRKVATRGICAIAFYSEDVVAPPFYANGGRKLLGQMAQTATREQHAEIMGTNVAGLEVVDEGLSPEQLKKLSPRERLAAQLARNVRLNFNQGQLADLCEKIEANLKVPVLIDRKSLNEAAFDTSTPIDWGCRYPIKLRLVLRQLLGDLALTSYNDEGTLVITSRTAAENRQIVRTYPIDPELLKVRKRLRRPQQFWGQFGNSGSGLFNVRQLGGLGSGGMVGTIPSHVGGGFGGGSGERNLFAEYDELDSLLNLITSIIQPTTWRTNGGLGDIQPNLQLGLLVVSNTEEVQDELAALLDVFNKKLAERKPPPVSPDAIERVVHPVVLPAVRLKQQNPLDHHRPISKEPAFTMEQLAELLKQQIEPASWAKPEHTISTLGQNLIVNQTRANQEKIRAFLRQLGITKEQVDDEKQFAEEEEQGRKDLVLRQAQEQERIEKERIQRQADEKKKQAEEQKLAAEREKREAERKQREEELTRAEIKRREEAKKLEEEKKQAEEKQRQEQNK